MYGNALDRLESQVDTRKNVALRALKWLTHAKERLNVLQLQHALATREGSKDVNETDLISDQMLVSFCAGLVAIDRESNSIRLVHYTTQEYLERRLSKPDADSEIAKTCLRYLSFDAFSKPFTDGVSIQLTLLDHELSGYATLHWAEHVQPAEEHYFETLRSLFQEQDRRDSLFQVWYWHYQPESWDRFRKAPTTSPLHLAAMHGMAAFCTMLLSDDRTSYSPPALAASDNLIGHLWKAFCANLEIRLDRLR